LADVPPIPACEICRDVPIPRQEIALDPSKRPLLLIEPRWIVGVERKWAVECATKDERTACVYASSDFCNYTNFGAGEPGGHHFAEEGPNAVPLVARHRDMESVNAIAQGSGTHSNVPCSNALAKTLALQDL